MTAVMVSLAYVVGILTALHAVMSTRTAQGAIAWSVSLITLPFVAVPAYWIFGRNKFLGFIHARQWQLDALSDLLEQVRSAVRSKARMLGFADEGIQAAERLARLPATAGNELELLVDGDATFDSIIEGFNRAEEYILIQFYIVRDDDLGKRIKDKLIERAQAGVQVSFLYDEIGSHGLSSPYLDDLQAAGVDIHAFNTRKGRRNRFQINFRNHRKIVVVDGRECWLGGLNIGDEYLGKDPKVGPWRDTHLHITGPATIAAQLSFTEDWNWATESLPENLQWSPTSAPGADAGVLVVSSGPADKFDTAALMYMHAISIARERIWIASPYFVPDEGIVSVLQLACFRGVDVRVMIPDKTDNRLVTLATYSFFDETHAAGVQFYRYLPGFMHQKVMLIDDVLASVGTANFDNRSFRLNFEITAVAADRKFAMEVESMLNDDFTRCRKMESNEFTSKPLWFRLAARASRLSSPIL